MSTRRQTRRPFIRALLVDVSGTLHIGATPIPGAEEAFRRLRAAKIPFRLCSNTSKESTASLVRRLHKLGFNIGHSPKQALSSTIREPDDGVQQRQYRSRQEIWTSIGAAAQYMKDKGLKQPYFLLSPSAKEEMTAAGIGGGPERNEGDLSYDSVVIGLAPELLDYSHLNTAFRILKGEYCGPANAVTSGHSQREGVSRAPCAKLIATHKAKYIESEVPAGLSMGPGPFVTALETATGIEAYTVGKPTKLFFETVINDFYATDELSKSDDVGIAVIGDDVEADLGDGAVAMGLWRILVRTGKYRVGDQKREGTTPPDEVFDSFAMFVESLLSEQGAKL